MVIRDTGVCVVSVIVPVGTLVLLSLDFGVTLGEESFPSGREIKPLSSSLQATNITGKSNTNKTFKTRIRPPKKNASKNIALIESRANT